MRVGIIGHFAERTDFCDGQTVKTRNLDGLLKSRGSFEIYRVDTYLNKLGGIVNKLILLIKSIYALITCKHVFLLVADKGMRFYLPFMYFLNKVTCRKIYHYIIGSELLELVDQNPQMVKYLNALTVNWFEYESGTKYLRSKGVQNVITLVNFKDIEPVERVAEYSDPHYRYCTFSRVNEEKGITEAITAIRDVNALYGKKVAALDIYGPVDNYYCETFESLLKENGSCVRYMGVADSNCSVSILKNYYALLFPTHWIGEGVPGTIIDAFASGIPIIASDWRANAEMVSDGKQGIVYPNSECDDLRESIVWSMEHRRQFIAMRKHARAEFEKYSPDSVMSVILDAMRF